MAPYSMDLRSRVLRDVDGGLSSNTVAAEYRVSRAWVDRVKQRRREHGEVGPRRQTVLCHRVLMPRDETRLMALITAQPEVTLVELRAALPTTAALSTLWPLGDPHRRRGLERARPRRPGCRCRPPRQSRLPRLRGAGAGADAPAGR